METDWAHLLAPIQIAALKPWVGVQGSAAQTAIPTLSGITIPWYSAWLSFIGKSLPSYVTQTRRAFANSQMLPPLCFGVLVSLVYNRGPRMIDSSSIQGTASRCAIFVTPWHRVILKQSPVCYVQWSGCGRSGMACEHAENRKQNCSKQASAK